MPQMQDETRRRYLFVAIERATRWVLVDIKDNKNAASAKPSCMPYKKRVLSTSKGC